MIGNICLNNLKSVISTPLGVAVMTTCIHGIGLLQQNDDIQLMVSNYNLVHEIRQPCRKNRFDLNIVRNGGIYKINFD